MRLRARLRETGDAHRPVADYNFNAVGFTLLRTEAQQEADKSAL